MPQEKDRKILIIASGTALVVLVMIGVVGSRPPVADDILTAPINVKDYAPEPEKELEFTCNNTTLGPTEVSVVAPVFLKFRFTNEGTAKQRFGIRTGSGQVIKSTRAIAPMTKASFSWRVPAVSAGLETFCSSDDEREEELTGALLIGA